MLEQYREGLKQQLITSIDVVDFIRKHTHPEWSGEEQQKLTCPLATTRHEGGDDSSPSLSINPSTGAFSCFGCGWKGTSIVGYFTDVKCEGNFKKSLALLFNEYVRETVPLSEIETSHRELMSKSNLIQKITATRGWTQDTLRKLKIGWNHQEKRTVIPIFNLQGYCIDIRMHDTLYRAPLVDGKRIPAKGTRNSRTGDWFPTTPTHNPFLNSEVWLVEGEPDTIIAIQDGLNALTLTGGAGAWKALDHYRLKALENKDVVICLDNDKAGQDAAQIISERLAAVGVLSLKNVIVPQGKDVSEFFLKYGGSGQQLKQYATAAPYLIKPKKRNVLTIPLSDTGKAEYIGKPIRSNVIISGKNDAPQAVPQRLKLTCSSTEFCGSCPCKATGDSDYYVKADDPDVLNWLYCKDYGQQVKTELHLPSKCRMQAEVTDWQNIEQVTIIPSLSTSRQADEGAYTTRRGYYIGHGIESNQNYEISAIPAIHPRSKESVLLIDKVACTYDSVSQFKLSTEDFKRLKEIFCDDPAKIIQDIAKMLAHNHTHIYGRQDLHIATDITFHSPSNFSCFDCKLPKGSMELLIFGDTRCGKGQVAEGLARFYDAGAIVSGENSSFMGLCGGAQKAGDNFQLAWGAIPINNGRLVIIDEFSGLDSTTLGRLSRVRSEGIAEINKGGINTRTRANTRLIWIANPAKGREIASFVNGISAIMDLVGTNEDVARFDLAIVVQKGEVDMEEINTLHSKQIVSKYTQEDLRKVLLWAWSRQDEHVAFTRQATDYMLEAANKLANTYSSTIPLIQGENARFKIAKIAASIAARTFSTEDGIFLRVTERHAQLAVALIAKLYNKPSMGYRQFSDVESGTRTLVDIQLLDEFFKQWPVHVRKNLIDSLMSVEKFGVREIQDWCDTDPLVAKKFAGLFVRCQAIKQLSQGLYVKKPAFITYLKQNKRKDGIATGS